jgi:hypothetical protein
VDLPISPDLLCWLVLKANVYVGAPTALLNSLANSANGGFGNAFPLDNKPIHRHHSIYGCQLLNWEVPTDNLVEELDARFRAWQPEIADQVRQHIHEIIELADHDGLDLLRSRTIEQEVMDSLDELPTR